MNELFGPLSAQARGLLHSVPAIIDKTFPLPGRFRAGLASDVAELSRLMTAARGERGLSYLSRPNHLSAYLRYFLPWNIFRLSRLLASLEISLSPGDAILDLGCGPLSFAAALWISRPDLRKIPLELRCVDRTAAVMEAGKKFFTALAGADCPWKIITIRAQISPAGTISYGRAGSGGASRQSGSAGRQSGGAAKQSGGRGAALVCAINVFNELYAKVSHDDRGGVRNAAANSARLLDSCAAAGAAILVAEPGVPFSGAFISGLRDALLERKRFPVSPCPHFAACPFPGGSSGGSWRKNRWCHFAFDTEAAPPELRRLSAAAGLPKDRATLSFLFAGPNPTASNEKQARIITDAFPLAEGKSGRYACSQKGLVLVTGRRSAIEACASGALVSAAPDKNGARDAKSGALLAEI